MGKRLKNAPTHLHMSPLAIQTLAGDIFGENSWRAPLCETMDISYSQLHRYMTVYQGQGVPKVFAMALVALHTFHEAKKPFPDMDAFRVEIDKATPVKFVQVKKERPAKVKAEDAPTLGLDFGPVEVAPVKEVKAAVASAKHAMGKATKQAKKAATKKPAKAPVKATKAKTPAKAAKPVRKPAKAPVKATKAKTPAKVTKRAKAPAHA
jgi:hypothetical protein